MTLYNEDITGGFHETEVDAVFLDLREPWLFLNHAWAALKGSGFFGSLLPTVNQAELLVAGLQALPFGDVRMEEIIVRPWKTVAARLRPEDRMIPHSAFLIFARKIEVGDESLSWMPDKKRRAYAGKLAMAARVAEEREARRGRPRRCSSKYPRHERCALGITTEKRKSRRAVDHLRVLCVSVVQSTVSRRADRGVGDYRRLLTTSAMPSRPAQPSAPRPPKSITGDAGPVGSAAAVATAVAAPGVAFGRGGSVEVGVAVGV